MYRSFVWRQWLFFAGDAHFWHSQCMVTPPCPGPLCSTCSILRVTLMKHAAPKDTLKLKVALICNLAT